MSPDQLRALSAFFGGVSFLAEAYVSFVKRLISFAEKNPELELSELLKDATELAVLLTKLTTLSCDIITSEKKVN